MEITSVFARKSLVNATSESKEQKPMERDQNYAPRKGATLFEAK